MRRALIVAAFAVAACAPLVTGSARTADLAGGLYVALAATGLAFAVGIGGVPLLAQGGFVGCGAVAGAHLVAAGVPTLLAAPAGAAVGALAGLLTGALVVRLPPAGVAAATWVLAWLASIALQSLPWFLGGDEGLVVAVGPTPEQHYELALLLLALAALGYAALERAPLGLRLAAARDHEAAADALGVPVLRVRMLGLGLAGAVAGLAGALGVELAGVGDATQYGPFLSFKLFVAVLIGGAAAPLGAAAGVVVFGLLSVAADAIGSLEHVAASRAHELLAAVMLLGVVSLGWQGLLRPTRKRWAAKTADPLPGPSHTPLVARGLTKRYGGVVALDDVSLTLEPGTVTAVIGPNGSGKTTLLRLLAGAVEPDSGTIDHGGVARTLQATAVFGSLTPLEHLLATSSGRRRHGGVARSLFSTPKARAEEARFTAAARATLDRFGLPQDVPAAELPVSEQRILMLVAAAATGAPALLVDEPAAGASHADGDRIAAALTALKEDGRAILVVEHNVALVRRIADHILAFGALLALVALLAGCGGHKGATKQLVVVVSAPFSSTPYLGRAIENGARLAAAQVNASGLNVKGTHYDLTVRTMDDALSPARAVANVRQAVADGAIAIVDDGTGTNASWRIAAKPGVPICIVFDGGTSLVDAKTRPNVFRIAPTDHGIAFRLAEYLIPKNLKVAILHDDSDYGVNGEVELKKAFAANLSSVAIDETVPADALDLSTEVLRARRAHATAILVWGRPATVAAAIEAARSAGWPVPFYTPPTGADPFVRQQLANHPSWVDGLTFAGGRLTAEVGAGPFEAFEQRYEQAYGVDKVGVKTRGGQEVVQPPETPMYAYDFVNLLAAAITRAGSTDPAKVTAALDEVTTEGANGDERSFNAVDHDGVVDDDVYFARFRDMTYAPVKDDPLSSTLPTIPQTR